MNAKPFLAANLGLAFALELVAFAAVGYGAFHVAHNAVLGTLLAAAVVGTSVVLWGAFAAPRAPRRHPLGVLIVKLVTFCSAVAALVSNGHAVLGVSLVVAVALNALALVNAGWAGAPQRRAPQEWREAAVQAATERREHR